MIPAPPPPEPVEWTVETGPLAAERAGGGPRLVFLHGFTQTGRSWRPIAEHFVRHGYCAVLVDLPGHGGSGHVRADLRRTADMVAAVGGEAAYIGYSLGGRVGLHLALMYPHLVLRLAVIGAHPGLDDDDERAARREHDAEVTRRLRETGVDAFLAEWIAQPLFGGLAADAADLVDRRRNTIEGLASSLQMAGTGTQTSLWPRLRELAMPVLAIAGADDTKFAPIAAQLARQTLDGRCALVPGAAHAAHLERPDAVIGLLAEFLGSA